MAKQGKRLLGAAGLSFFLATLGILVATITVMAAEPSDMPGGQGHPLRGQALFVGTVPFENGGAPCLACHGIAGLGPAGGANYGGDLTGIWENFGPDGVTAILEDLSFPSMEPIFAERPLTETERADLAAFFQSIPGGSAPMVRMTFGLGGLLVAVGCLALAALAGRNRLRRVRRPLVDEKRESIGR